MESAFFMQIKLFGQFQSRIFEFIQLTETEKRKAFEWLGLVQKIEYLLYKRKLS